MSDLLAPVTDRVERLAAAREIRVSLRREGDAARCAREERHTELGLELRDRLAHGGRRHPEPLGGAAKALLLGHVNERNNAGKWVHAPDSIVNFWLTMLRPGEGWCAPRSIRRLSFEGSRRAQARG